jgi:hypothetical protein
MLRSVVLDFFLSHRLGWRGRLGGLKSRCESFEIDISGGVDGGVRAALAPLEPDSLAKSLAMPLMDTCKFAELVLPDREELCGSGVFSISQNC